MKPITEITETKPIRLQRKRVKGFKLTSPNGLPNKYVGRPTIWGNPYSVNELNKYMDYMRNLMANNPDKYLYPLLNKNLVCWCNLNNKCHADILLDLMKNETSLKIYKPSKKFIKEFKNNKDSSE